MSTKFWSWKKVQNECAWALKTIKRATMSYFYYYYEFLYMGVSLLTIWLISWTQKLWFKFICLPSAKWKLIFSRVMVMLEMMVTVTTMMEVLLFPRLLKLFQGIDIFPCNYSVFQKELSLEITTRIEGIQKRLLGPSGMVLLLPKGSLLGESLRT